MTTVYLKLRFSAPHEDPRSTAGSSWIVPGSYGQDNDGEPLLTPHCATLGEIEWHIDRFKAELEEIRKEARRKYAAATKDRRAPVW